MLLLMSRHAGRGSSWNSLVLTTLSDMSGSTPGSNTECLPCGKKPILGASHLVWRLQDLCCDTLSSLIMVESIFCGCSILSSRLSSISHSGLWNSAHSAVSFPHSSDHFYSIDSYSSSKILTQRYWVTKARKALPALAGLTFSKEPVSRGEGLPCVCACLMFQRQYLWIPLEWIPLWRNICFRCLSYSGTWDAAVPGPCPGCVTRPELPAASCPATASPPAATSVATTSSF